MNQRWRAIGQACLVACLVAWAVLGVGVGAGCDSGDDFDPDPATPNNSVPGGTGSPCKANTAYTCTGANNCAGVRSCGTDRKLTACICSATPAVDSGRPDGGMMELDGSIATDAGTHDAATLDAGDREPPTKQEICDNSKDDDADGDIDCADADCGARLCAPKAPAGWTGPTLRALGDDPPGCKGNYPDAVAEGGSIAAADPAECSTCSCEAPNVACASVLDFTSGADAACGGVSCTASITSTCTELTCPYLGASSGYVGSELPANLPHCSASEQVADVDGDAHFSERMVACAPDADLRQGGCAEGEVCAPKTPFDGDICIVREGDHSCPAGQYSKRHVYYTRIEDTRSCSECACGHDCAYKWQVFDAADTTCANAATAELTAGDQCAAVTPTAGKLQVRAHVTGTGACTPSGGTPTGSVSGGNPITVCCVQ